ncbi:MAG: glycosyltransferase family 39 protein [Patescibacteria group bacterium]
MNKQFWISSLVILLLAAVLRFWNLNSLPIFADESIYVRWSQVMRAESTLRFLPLSDGKQPFFMWATIPFLKLVSDPLLAGRALSVLAGLGSVVGIGLASFLLFKNPRQTTVTVLIAAVLPYLVFFDRMALADSLLAMFLVWTFVFSYLSFIHKRLDLAMFAGFTLGFAWLTKSPAIFAFFLLPLNILFIPKYSVKNLLISIFYFLVSVTIAFGMYNILRLGPEFHQIALRNADYVFPLSEVLRRPLDPLLPHLKDSFLFFAYFLTPLGLLAAVSGILSGGRSHWQSRLILAAWWLGPVLVQSAIARGFTARYLLFTVPFATILIALAVEHIGQRTQKHFLSIAAAGLIVVPALVMDYLAVTRPESLPLPRIERSGYLEDWTAGYGLRDVAQSLRQYAAAGPVLVGSEGYFGTPFDALKLYLNDVPNVRIIGVGVWIDSVSDKLKSALRDNQVFLVVNSTRLHADPDQMGLKLISSYPKAYRPDGTREYLLFFQVLKP